MQRDLELGALAAAQASFISSRQAAEYGLSPAAIRWRVEQRLWTPVRNGLYRVNGVEVDMRGLIRGGVAILPDAAASTSLLPSSMGLRPSRKGKWKVTVYARTTHSYPGVTVRRSLDLAPHHLVTVDNLKTTNIARTLIDLAAVCRKGMVARAMDDQLASGRVQIEELVAVFEETARPGRTGSKAIRELLNERIGDELVSASRLERVGIDLFERGGLPRPEWQFPAPGIRTSELTLCGLPGGPGWKETDVAGTPEWPTSSGTDAGTVSHSSISGPS